VYHCLKVPTYVDHAVTLCLAEMCTRYCGCCEHWSTWSLLPPFSVTFTQRSKRTPTSELNHVVFQSPSPDLPFGTTCRREVRNSNFISVRFRFVKTRIWFGMSFVRLGLKNSVRFGCCSYFIVTYNSRILTNFIMDMNERTEQLCVIYYVTPILAVYLPLIVT